MDARYSSRYCVTVFPVIFRKRRQQTSRDRCTCSPSFSSEITDSYHYSDAFLTIEAPFYFLLGLLAVYRTSKLATTSSTGGLLLALQRAIVTARPKGRYRKHFCWPAIKRYYSNLLVSILLLALLYTFELLHLLYCQSFQHNIL